MDQGNPQFGTHQGQLLGAVIGAVVHIQALRQSAAQDRLLEHRQKGLGVLRQGKGGIRNDPGGIVDEGDQVGLAPDAPPYPDAWPVHHIAHPQLPGLGEGEAAAVVIAWVVLGLVHQAMAGEQPVHGGQWQRQIRGDLGRLARRADDQLHRQIGVVLLGRQQGFDHRGGQGTGLTAVSAGLRQQRLEAAAPIGLEPIAQGLGGYPGATAAGDGVVERGLGGEALVEPLAAGG